MNTEGEHNHAVEEARKGAGGHKPTSSTFLKGVLLLCRAGFGAPISCVFRSVLSASASLLHLALHPYMHKMSRVKSIKGGALSEGKEDKSLNACKATTMAEKVGRSLGSCAQH